MPTAATAAVHASMPTDAGVSTRVVQTLPPFRFGKHIYFT